MPNSNPSRNAKYLSNAQLCQAFSPKKHPLESTKTQFSIALSKENAGPDVPPAKPKRGEGMPPTNPTRIIARGDLARHRAVECFVQHSGTPLAECSRDVPLGDNPDHWTFSGET